MYYYELHMHTSETSRCGRSSAYDMVKAYKDKGFTGVVVTDHFVNGYSYANIDAPWSERMDLYLKGYKNALAAGEELGIDVYLGWEFTNSGNNGEDYVTMGLTEDDLYHNLVDCDKMTIEQYIDAVHALGGIVMRAHPYREAAYMKQCCIERPGLSIDAVEVCNGGNVEDRFDERALEFARRENIPMAAGSDTHHVDTTATAYIGLDEKPADYQALCDAIKGGKAHVIQMPKVFMP